MLALSGPHYKLIQKKWTIEDSLQFMQKHFADKATIELVEIDNIPLLFNKPRP